MLKYLPGNMFFSSFIGCSRIVPFNISSCFDDGKFHGAQSFLGLVAQ
jgi:hypothetical protein